VLNSHKFLCKQIPLLFHLSKLFKSVLYITAVVLSKINGKVYRPSYKKGVGNPDYLRIEEVLDNEDLMTKLVQKNPEEAIRIFHIRENLRLGEMICECYKHNPDYNATIKDIKEKIKSSF